MITSLLDNDLYKFTMQNAVIKLFPHSLAKYTFINRNGVEFPDGFADALKIELQKLSLLKLSNEEKQFLKEKCYYLDPTYLDFLAGFQFNPSELLINQQGGELSVDIEGYWYRTILWEVPLLALISELYYKIQKINPISEKEIIEKVKVKSNRFNDLGINIAEFGTRRRFSKDNHKLVVETLKQHCMPSFIGTSNVMIAMENKLTPIGTHAHEWFMFHSAKYGFVMADKLALENWVDVYRGDLGIALADTFTSNVFYRHFDTKFAKLFDGVRHDSGDPFLFVDKTIDHYQRLNINPMLKTIIFSDSLNADGIEKISAYCKNKINCSFGVGTNLTNDVGVKPLNIVIKMVEAKPEGQEWTHTVKLSDSEGKYSGDEKTIQLCKDTLNI